MDALIYIHGIYISGYNNLLKNEDNKTFNIILHNHCLLIIITQNMLISVTIVRQFSHNWHCLYY